MPLNPTLDTCVCESYSGTRSPLPSTQLLLSTCLCRGACWLRVPSPPWQQTLHACTATPVSSTWLALAPRRQVCIGNALMSNAACGNPAECYADDDCTTWRLLVYPSTQFPCGHPVATMWTIPGLCSRSQLGFHAHDLIETHRRAVIRLHMRLHGTDGVKVSRATRLRQTVRDARIDVACCCNIPCSRRTYVARRRSADLPASWVV